LAGYLLQQKTGGINLNLDMSVVSATNYTIHVDVGGDMLLKQVWYYRITYDRTAL